MDLYQKKYRNFIGNFLGILFFLFLNFTCKAVFGATVSSVSQNTAMNFGSIDALSGGGINNCVASGPKILSGSGCTAGSFSVVGTNSAGSNSTTFKIFITNPDINLTNSGNDLAVTFSTSSSSVVDSQTYDFDVGSGSKNFSVTIYGNLNVSMSQAPGNYIGNYGIVACSCDNDGCPLSASDTKCVN